LARQLSEQFYGDYHHDGWHDQLSQAEIDHLLAEGRLRTWVNRANSPTNSPGSWQALPRSAAEVNASQHQPGFGHHDAINRWILIKYRCQAQRQSHLCQHCNGQGTLGSAEAITRHDAWQPSDPPHGEGIQLWETVSEGAPISPVFDSTDAGRQALAQWLSDNERLPSGAPGDLGDWELIVYELAQAVDIASGELC
jgi:hypothetical protein